MLLILLVTFISYSIFYLYTLYILFRDVKNKAGQRTGARADVYQVREGLSKFGYLVNSGNVMDIVQLEMVDD